MKALITLFIFCMTPLLATVYKNIDTTQPFHCNFSHSYHNRILLESGRINKVIYPEEKLLVHMEEVSGQAFIQARDTQLPETIISVVTQDGKVQDLILNFTQSLGEIVVLREPTEEKIASPKNSVCMTPSERREQTIEIIMQGEIPEGYFSIQPPRRVKQLSGIRSRLIKQFKGCNENLLIIEIKNMAFWKKGLLEKQFSCPNTLWVCLEKNSLKPREKIIGIIAVKS